MKEEIDRHFAGALGYSMLTIGEMQALKMLVALLCLAEVVLEGLPQGMCASASSLSYIPWQP